MDYASVVARVDADAGWSPRYAFMAVMSAGIAVLGLLLSSPAVVIGAMLISPLMGPIIGLGFALAIFEWREVRRSAIALIFGSILAVAFCALIVILSPLQSVTPEILARTRPNLFDLLVAVFSALAGSYATIRGRGETIVGVAIATALMPPLAAVGYGLATWNLTVFGGAVALFVTNLIAIALSAAVMARVYGFGSELSPKQTRLQAGLIVAVLVALAVPLALALQQIAEEAIAVRQIRSALAAHFGESARVSQLDIDFAAEPMAVRAVVLTDRYLASAGATISEGLGATLGQPLSLRLSQIVVDQDASRLAQERAVLKESLAASAAGDGASLAADIALLTAAAPDDIVIDPTARRATAFARPRPGLTLAGWRAAEGRLRQRHADWRIEVTPPVGDLPRITFEPGVSGLDGAPGAAAEDIAWALFRWRVSAVSVTGFTASSDDAAPGRAAVLARLRADAVAARLAARGIAVIVAIDPSGPRQRAAERAVGAARFRSVEVRPVLPAGKPTPDEPETPGSATWTSESRHRLSGDRDSIGAPRSARRCPSPAGSRRAWA